MRQGFGRYKSSSPWTEGLPTAALPIVDIVTALPASLAEIADLVVLPSSLLKQLDCLSVHLQLNIAVDFYDPTSLQLTPKGRAPLEGQAIGRKMLDGKQYGAPQIFQPSLQALARSRKDKIQREIAKVLAGQLDRLLQLLTVVVSLQSKQFVIVK
jgi:hypothetical protein